MIELIVSGLVIGLVLLLVLLASRYQKVAPNQALIVSGRRHLLRDEEGRVHRVGFRVVKGGGTVVLPVVEKVDRLSLETMTIEVGTPEVYTQQGVPIIVAGVAQIKVKGDEISIATAAEQFLSKNQDEMKMVVRETLEGHLRAILGMMTVEEVYRNREAFAQRVQDVSASDMANMGFAIISFTIKDVHDKQGYLDALGKPRIAQVKRDAAIAEAEAASEAQIKRAHAAQLGRMGELESQTRIAEAERDYNQRVAQYNAVVNQERAQADLAYDLQKFKTEQLVKAEEIKVDIVRKEQEIQVQEREVARRERELMASIQKPADAERYRIQALAEAEQYRLKAEAAGRAEATRLAGLGEAEAERARGLAEAEVIRAQGEAQAYAMASKASAWERYNEAAIFQMLTDRLPEIARAISEPLSKTERIVVISQDGKGAGTARVTRDITDIVAQVPEVVEALTGMRVQELVQRITRSAGAEEPNGKGSEVTAELGGTS